MNLNELFFFKVFPCKKNDSFHSYKNCYFFHNNNKNDSYNSNNNNNIDNYNKNNLSDKRRIPINFEKFLLNIEGASELAGYNTIKNELEYYTNQIKFEITDINKEIFSLYSPCLNNIEYSYHIKNIYNKQCPYYYNKIKCPYGKLCYNYHERNNIDYNNLYKLKDFINNITKKDSFIYLSDIILMFNSILSFNNNFISDENLMKKFKNILIPYENIIKKNINRNNIYPQNNPNIVIKRINNNNDNISNSNSNNYIKKGMNFYTAFNINKNDLCYCSTEPIKIKEESFRKIIEAFLNTHSGFILYGVDVNSDKIIGQKFNRKDRDDFKINFNYFFINILIEFEENLKFEFFDIDNKGNCVLLISIKKLKNTILIKDKISEVYYMIKSKVINKINEKKVFKINKDDIIDLNKREYIDVMIERYINYYTKKITKEKDIEIAMSFYKKNKDNYNKKYNNRDDNINKDNNKDENNNKDNNKDDNKGDNNNNIQEEIEYEEEEEEESEKE